MAGKIWNFLKSPQGRDSLLTTLTEGLSMLGMILTYRLAAQVSKQDLDIYVIVRRTVSFVFPIILMGAMVGLTRYVAMSRGPEQKRGYLRGAFAWVLPLSVLTMLLSMLLAKPLAWAIYGTEDSAPLVPPLALMAVGITLHGVAYGFLRGKPATITANFVQLMVLAIIPCGAFMLWSDMATVLWATGIGWVAVPLLSIAPSLAAATRDGKRRQERSELLRYGLPRVPGDVALGALLTIPGYVALRTHGLDVSGEVGFGATLLNLAAAVFSPVALLLLPAAAGRLASGDHLRLEKQIARMTRLVFLVSVALTIGFELLSRPLLLAYLGPTGEAYLPMARIIFIGALPFAFFNGMRSVLDAYFHTPRNGLNLLAAFGILLAGSVFHLAVPTPWYTMGIVLVASMCWLGWATWRDVRYVRSELVRLGTRDNGQLRIMAVVPGEKGAALPKDLAGQFDVLGNDGAVVTVFRMPRRASPARLVKLRRQMKKRLAKDRPDVVHVHYGSLTALFAVLVSNVPVVITFAGPDLDRSGTPGKWRPLLGGLFSQVAAFFASGIICPHAEVRDRLWWRQGEAKVLPLGPVPASCHKEVLVYLKAVVMHGPTGQVEAG